MTKRSRVEQLERDIAVWAAKYERSRQTYAMVNRRASNAERLLDLILEDAGTDDLTIGMQAAEAIDEWRRTRNGNPTQKDGLTK